MKKTDWILIAAIVAVAAIAFVVPRLFAGDAAAGVIEIHVGNSETPYKSVALGKPQTVVVEREGKRNEIEITENGARMKNASCPDQQCVHQEEVTLQNYQTRILGAFIICLPNEVWVELVPAQEAQ